MQHRIKMIAAFLLTTVLCATGQVSVAVLQKSYKPHEKIDFAIANTGYRPISFCVEFGHWSVSESGNTESTPTPVFVQRRTAHGWSTLLIGPDVGSSRHSVSMAPGETQHYPLRLVDQGHMRAVLYYWIGENEKVCENPKDKKSAKSNQFIVE